MVAPASHHGPPRYTSSIRTSTKHPQSLPRLKRTEDYRRHHHQRVADGRKGLDGASLPLPISRASNSQGPKRASYPASGSAVPLAKFLESGNSNASVYSQNGPAKNPGRRMIESLKEFVNTLLSKMPHWSNHAASREEQSKLVSSTGGKDEIDPTSFSAKGKIFTQSLPPRASETPAGNLIAKCHSRHIRSAKRWNRIWFCLSAVAGFGLASSLVSLLSSTTSGPPLSGAWILMGLMPFS